MLNHKIALALSISLVAVCLIGCGGGGPKKLKLVTAKGKVLLDDKSPGPASLTFNPVAMKEDPRPVLGAVVAADGSFSVTTYKNGDGAPPGDYNVTLGGPSSDLGSADPAAMMRAISGNKAEPVKVTIPPAGTSTLELKFVSKESGPEKPGTILNAAPK